MSDWLQLCHETRFLMPHYNHKLGSHTISIGVEKCALSRRCSHVHKYVWDCVTCVPQCNSDKRMEVKNAYMSLSGFEHVSLIYMVQNMYKFFTEWNFSLSTKSSISLLLKMGIVSISQTSHYNIHRQCCTYFQAQCRGVRSYLSPTFGSQWASDTRNLTTSRWPFLQQTRKWSHGELD